MQVQAGAAEAGRALSELAIAVVPCCMVGIGLSHSPAIPAIAFSPLIPAPPAGCRVPLDSKNRRAISADPKTRFFETKTTDFRDQNDGASDDGKPKPTKNGHLRS